eukprot:scaffold11155_cov141-Isochrysis_galbana.AAC.12
MAFEVFDDVAFYWFLMSVRACSWLSPVVPGRLTLSRIMAQVMVAVIAPMSYSFISTLRLRPANDWTVQLSSCKEKNDKAERVCTHSCQPTRLLLWHLIAHFNAVLVTGTEKRYRVQAARLAWRGVRGVMDAARGAAHATDRHAGVSTATLAFINNCPTWCHATARPWTSGGGDVFFQPI